MPGTGFLWCVLCADLSTGRLIANALGAQPRVTSCWFWCRFPALRSLDLSTCRLAADRQLQGLGALQLTSLSLARCEALTCAGLQHVGMLPTLAELDLEGCCRVSEPSWHFLATMAGLPGRRYC